MKRLSLGIAALFVLLNIYFVMTDKDNKIDRISHIKNWTELKEHNLYKKMQTDGVLNYTDEQFVFFDERLGSFQEFLVNQGDLVHEGDELYTYQVHNYEDMELKLEGQVRQLENEISAVEEAISKVEDQNIDQSTIMVLDENNEEVGSIEHHTPSAELMKEQYMIEKEKELNQLEAKLESAEEQLSDLLSGDKVMTVQSPYSGKVTNISSELDNPIVTIESAELSVFGELSEKERMLVEKDMKAEIKLNEQDDEKAEVLPGKVYEVSEVPKQIDLKADSIYPFYIAFDQDKIKPNTLDSLLPGYHASINIVLVEALDAVAVPEKALFDSSVWKMTPSGKLMKQKIQKGIHDDGYIEIKEEDVNSGDWIAVANDNKFYNNATFITSFKPGDFKWKQIKNEAHRKRSLFIGLLGR